MFSLKQKQEIADKVQQILRETNHPELPEGEISFQLHVDGAEDWSWADIRNNGYFSEDNQPGVNGWNEAQDRRMTECGRWAKMSKKERIELLKREFCFNDEYVKSIYSDDPNELPEDIKQYFRA